jgi:hypothetical protein
VSATFLSVGSARLDGADREPITVLSHPIKQRWTDASSGDHHLVPDPFRDTLDGHLRTLVEELMDGSAIELHEQIIGFAIFFGMPILAFLAAIFWRIVFDGEGN